MKINPYTKYNNFGKTYIYINRGVIYGNNTQRGSGYSTDDVGK